MKILKFYLIILIRVATQTLRPNFTLVGQLMKILICSPPQKGGGGPHF